MLSSFTFAENYRRNTLRNECRHLVRAFDPSVAGSGMGFVNASEWMEHVADTEDRGGHSNPNPMPMPLPLPPPPPLALALTLTPNPNLHPPPNTRTDAATRRSPSE